eukprot:GFUD01066962.1.p1 GENE.GFUD01066962.1~~GFUD01066962.1.p1  ORF type:complete len:258 (-),score=56.49 GFUD01066962.1:16-789(-)
MSSPDTKLLSLPPEILSNMFTFLSQSSVCQLERCSKTARTAVLETDFWRKQAESLSKPSKSNFVRNLLVKVRKQGYVSAVIYKMIVRASSKLDTMVEDLKGFMKHIRGDISRIAAMLDHDDYAYDFETGEDACEGCANTSLHKDWKLELIPVEKKLEVAELAKDFVDEGISDIKRRFIHSMKGVEPTLRENCFDIYDSEVEISIYCHVDEIHYPEGFAFFNGDHIMWRGEDDYEYGESDDADEETESSEDNDDKNRD